MSIHPSVSVIIPTYTFDRWDDLIAAAWSVQQQTYTPHEIIVVVDHNDDLYSLAQRQLTEVHVIVNIEPKGLSGARNSGIAVATGDLIAFLDDDAIADPDWLAYLVKKCIEPKVMGVGGKILPLWNCAFPKWFPEEFYWVIGCTYRGAPNNTAPIRNVIGASMCFRREVFDNIGSFLSSTGRVNEIPLGCEETELCIRARQHWPEMQFVYEPQAIVHHRVPAKRVTWRYFYSRCYHEGRSKAEVARLVGALDGLSSERKYTFVTLPTGVLINLFRAILTLKFAYFIRAISIIGGLVTTIAGYGISRILSYLRHSQLRIDHPQFVEQGPDR